MPVRNADTWPAFPVCDGHRVDVTWRPGMDGRIVYGRATMPGEPRKKVFDPKVVGVYHCYSQCVRQEMLCGFVKHTGKDYGYRRTWIVDRLKQLAGSMALDVLDFSVMGNHLHVMLRNRPDIVEAWTDEEVARRWWNVCPRRKNKDGTPKPPRQSEIDTWVNEPGKIDALRSRISHISWFMRLLLQPIARRANQEDEARGRFFAERFGCKRIVDDAGLLACSMYVGLNPVHAGIVERLEDYPYGSPYERIEALQQTHQNQLYTDGERQPYPEPHARWLAPVFLDERAEAYEKHMTVKSGKLVPQHNPIGSTRISDKGYLPITVHQYLALMDWTGREVRKDKPGAVPVSLAPILKRLNISPKKWIRLILNFDASFRYCIGHVESVRAAAERMGTRWAHDQTMSAEHFS